jgi:hypothetical protein
MGGRRMRTRSCLCLGGRTVRDYTMDEIKDLSHFRLMFLD